MKVKINGSNITKNKALALNNKKVNKKTIKRQQKNVKYTVNTVAKRKKRKSKTVGEVDFLTTLSTPRTYLLGSNTSCGALLFMKKILPAPPFPPEKKQKKLARESIISCPQPIKAIVRMRKPRVESGSCRKGAASYRTLPLQGRGGGGVYGNILLRSLWSEKTKEYAPFARG